MAESACPRNREEVLIGWFQLSPRFCAGIHALCVNFLTFPKLLFRPTQPNPAHKRRRQRCEQAGPAYAQMKSSPFELKMVNDQSKPEEVYMDENPPSNALQSQTVPTGVDLPPPPPPPLPSDSPCAKPPSYWLKKFLACNPFYLVSAALLLYGFYLVSSDANFPGREAYQLGFNFGSLQFYEVLLVATAIFLARRRIWYDSVLLTGLENLLVLVPFILISQAALLNQ